MMQGTNNFEVLLTLKPDTITWNAERTMLREVYVSKGNEDTPTARIIFCYSSGMNHLKASLNKTLDSARKMKLYRIEMLYDEFYSRKEDRSWPAMEFITEMKEISAVSAKMIFP